MHSFFNYGINSYLSFYRKGGAFNDNEKEKLDNIFNKDTDRSKEKNIVIIDYGLGASNKNIILQCNKDANTGLFELEFIYYNESNAERKIDNIPGRDNIELLINKL